MGTAETGPLFQNDNLYNPLQQQDKPTMSADGEQFADPQNTDTQSDDPQSSDASVVKEQSRRTFLKRTGVAAAGAASLMASGNFAYAGGSDKIKIGIVGCGGRGTGAVKNCVDSSEGVELRAMGDLFEDRLERSQKLLQGAIGDSYQVGDRDFIGFDAYKQVLDTDIDLVLLTSPPGFRPHHLTAAVEAGTHVFM